MWFLYFAALVANVAAFIPKLVSEFEISHPGFITLVSNRTSGKQTFDIIVSQFNGIPFSTDYVSLVRDIGNPKSWTAAHVESLSSKLHWPNEPNSVPGKCVSNTHLSKSISNVFNLHCIFPS